MGLYLTCGLVDYGLTQNSSLACTRDELVLIILLTYGFVRKILTVLSHMQLLMLDCVVIYEMLPSSFRWKYIYDGIQILLLFPRRFRESNCSCMTHCSHPYSTVLDMICVLCFLYILVFFLRRTRHFPTSVSCLCPCSVVLIHYSL